MPETNGHDGKPASTGAPTGAGNGSGTSGGAGVAACVVVAAMIRAPATRAAAGILLILGSPAWRSANGSTPLTPRARRRWHTARTSGRGDAGAARQTTLVFTP